MRLLVFGAGGQVGSALRTLYPEAIYLDRKDADFSHPDRLEELLESHAPECIINASAYTQVDNAEAEKDLVQVINADAPAAIAIYCAANDIPFVHFSTDYVFDGSGEKAWKEDDRVGPLSSYGRSKLAGEDQIQRIGKRFLIFRTAWLYDAHGRNFANTILRLAGEREELKIVSDQFGAPTYAPHLAQATLEALEAALLMPKFPSGIYHLCSHGVTNWHAFAEAIIGSARVQGANLRVKQVHAIRTEDYPTLATRPKNSRLEMSKFEKTFGLRMPSWQDGLDAYMREKFPA